MLPIDNRVGVPGHRLDSERAGSRGALDSFLSVSFPEGEGSEGGDTHHSGDDGRVGVGVPSHREALVARQLLHCLGVVQAGGGQGRGVEVLEVVEVQALVQSYRPGGFAERVVWLRGVPRYP